MNFDDIDSLITIMYKLTLGRIQTELYLKHFNIHKSTYTRNIFTSTVYLKYKNSRNPVPVPNSSGPTDFQLVNSQISQIVPLKGLVNFVDRNGNFKKNVPLRHILKRVDQSKEILTIASLVKKDDVRQDPHVVCKIQPLNLNNNKNSDTHHEEDSKNLSKKRRKPPTTKTVIISWNIASRDLKEQKSIALRSVLSKGDTLQLELCIKDRNKRPKQLSSIDIEKRELLIEQCKEICSQWGDLYGRVEGNTTNVTTMVFKPKKEAIE